MATPNGEQRREGHPVHRRRRPASARRPDRGPGPVVLRAGLRHQGLAGLAHRRGRLHPARPDGQPGRLLRRRRLLDERVDHEHVVPERHHVPAGAGRQRAVRRDMVVQQRLSSDDHDRGRKTTTTNSRSPIRRTRSSSGRTSALPPTAAHPSRNLAANQTIAIRGIEVDLNDVFLTQSCSFGGTAKVHVRAVLGRRRELVHPPDDEQPQHDHQHGLRLRQHRQQHGLGHRECRLGRPHMDQERPDGRELPGPRRRSSTPRAGTARSTSTRCPCASATPSPRTTTDRHAHAADREGPQRRTCSRAAAPGARC